MTPNKLNKQILVGLKEASEQQSLSASKDEKKITEFSQPINCSIFKLTHEPIRNPIDNKVLDATIIDSPDWVQTIALTPDKEIIMVKQFRYGTQKFHLEFPGGIIDKNDDSVVAAAIRELQEETGYAPTNSETDATLIDSVYVNPAFMTNEQYTVFMKNVVLKSEQKLDQNESIEILKVPLNVLADEKILYEGRVLGVEFGDLSSKYKRFLLQHLIKKFNLNV